MVIESAELLHSVENNVALNPNVFYCSEDSKTVQGYSKTRPRSRHLESYRNGRHYSDLQRPISTICIKSIHQNVALYFTRNLGVQRLSAFALETRRDVIM
jgi:hypothetical protein